ncbi:MAG TPA: hypothetical protein PKA95_02245, partial [Thermomicrobiales bacterium]|nr:hypothetical protein [Thermomicrobiales bacterium]
NDIGWILLAAAIVAVPVIVYALITGYRAYALDPVEQRVAMPAAPRARGASREPSLPPRVPATAGAEHPGYKAEPAPAATPATHETRPLVVTESVHTAEPEPEDDLAEQMSDTDPHFVLPKEALNNAPEAAEADSVEKTVAEEAAEPAAEPTGNLPKGYVHCRKCRAVLGPGMDVCPNCGTPRAA